MKSKTTTHQHKGSLIEITKLGKLCFSDKITTPNDRVMSTGCHYESRKEALFQAQAFIDIEVAKVHIAPRFAAFLQALKDEGFADFQVAWGLAVGSELCPGWDVLASDLENIASELHPQSA